MIRKSIIHLIQLKNPHFSLDNAVTLPMILAMILPKIIAYLRGWKILLYAKIPNKLFLGKGVSFYNLAKIDFGKWVQLEQGVCVSALCTDKVKFGNNVKIGAYSRIIAATSFNNIGSFIYIGNNVGIGEFAYLGGGGGLEIGDDCIVGQYLSCHPENHCYQNLDVPIRLQKTERKGIKIGKNCWIGAKVTILDGVQIGDNSIIAAGAVVNKSFPANCIIGGVPAKILKNIASETTISIAKCL